MIMEHQISPQKLVQEDTLYSNMTILNILIIYQVEKVLRYVRRNYMIILGILKKGRKHKKEVQLGPVLQTPGLNVDTSLLWEVLVSAQIVSLKLTCQGWLQQQLGSIASG